MKKSIYEIQNPNTFEPYNEDYLIQALANLGQRFGLQGRGITCHTFSFKNIIPLETLNNLPHSLDYYVGRIMYSGNTIDFSLVPSSYVYKSDNDRNTQNNQIINLFSESNIHNTTLLTEDIKCNDVSDPFMVTNISKILSNSTINVNKNDINLYLKCQLEQTETKDPYNTVLFKLNYDNVLKHVNSAEMWLANADKIHKIDITHRTGEGIETLERQYVVSLYYANLSDLNKINSEYVEYVYNLFAAELEDQTTQTITPEIFEHLNVMLNAVVETNVNNYRLTYNKNITLYTAGTETSNTENSITVFETAAIDNDVNKNIRDTGHIDLCNILSTTIPNLVCGAMPYLVRLHSETHYTNDIQTLYNRILCTLFERSYEDFGYNEEDNAMMFFSLNENSTAVIQYMSSDEDETDIYYIPMLNITNMSNIRRSASSSNNSYNLPGITYTSSNSNIPDKSVMYSVFCVYAEFMSDAYLRPFVDIDDDILLYCDCRKAYTMPYINYNAGDKNSTWFIDGLDTQILARGKDAGNPNIILLGNEINISQSSNSSSSITAEVSTPNIINPSIFNYDVVENFIQNKEDKGTYVEVEIDCGSNVSFTCEFLLPKIEDNEYYVDVFKDSTILYVSHINEDNNVLGTSVPMSGMNIITFWTLQQVNTTEENESPIYKYKFIPEAGGYNNNNKKALYIISSSTSLAQLLQIDSKYMQIATAKEFIENEFENRTWDDLKLNSNITSGSQESADQSTTYTVIANNNLSLEIKNELETATSDKYLDEISKDYTGTHPAIVTPYGTGQTYIEPTYNLNYVATKEVLTELSAQADYESITIKIAGDNYGQDSLTNTNQYSPSDIFNPETQSLQATLQASNFNIYVQYNDKKYTNEYLPKKIYPEVKLSEMLIRDANVINRANILSFSKKSNKAFAYYAYIGTSIDESSKKTLHIGTDTKNINLGTETLVSPTTRFYKHNNLSVDFENITLNSSYVHLKENTAITENIMSYQTSYSIKNMNVEYIGQYTTPMIMTMDTSYNEASNPLNMPQGNELYTRHALVEAKESNGSNYSSLDPSTLSETQLYIWQQSNTTSYIQNELNSNKHTARIINLYTDYNSSTRKFETLGNGNSNYYRHNDPYAKFPIRVNLKKFVKESLYNTLKNKGIDLNTANLNILFNNPDNYPVAFESTYNCLYMFMNDIALKTAMLTNVGSANTFEYDDDINPCLRDITSIPVNLGANARMTVTYLKATAQYPAYVRVDVSLTNNLFANEWPTTHDMSYTTPTMTNQYRNIRIL